MQYQNDSKSVIIDPTEVETTSKYISHAVGQQNLWRRVNEKEGKMFLFASRNIMPKELLFWNYGIPPKEKRSGGPVDAWMKMNMVIAHVYMGLLHH